VLVGSTLLLAVVSALAGCGDRASQGGAPPGATAHAELLFVVQATGASIVSSGSGQAATLRLTGVAPNLLAFADRPLRVATTQPTASLGQRWAEYGFASVPPNGALVISGRTLEEPLALELREPRYDPATAPVDIAVTSLAPDLDASLRSLLAATGAGCSVSLFIDATTSTAAPTPATGDAVTFIATLSQLTGRSFTSAQQDLITRALGTLLQLASDSPDSGDPQLIESNVETFLDNLEQVLELTFSSDERRQLTGVLARMTGIAA
jgi:hypothetical protein